MRFDSEAAIYPKDFHYTYSEEPKPESKLDITPTPGHSRLAKNIEDLAINYDSTTVQPVLAWRKNPNQPLITSSITISDHTVEQYIQEFGDLWNLSKRDFSSVKFYSHSKNGLNTVRLIQQSDDVEVFGSDVSVSHDNEENISAICGQLYYGADKALQAAKFGNLDKIALTCFNIGLSDLLQTEHLITGLKHHIPDADPGSYRWYNIIENDAKNFSGPLRIKKVLYPLGKGKFELGIYLELSPKDYPAFSYVISIKKPHRILFRKNLTDNIAFKYRVHNTNDEIFRPEDSPAPATPHPTGQPDGFQAPTIPEKLITIESLLPGDPWLPDNATFTAGNNCLAYGDITAPDHFNPGDVPGQTSGQNEFDHVYDHTKPPADATNLQASLAGMFFTVNWVHDRWYEFGFDEASGNAQTDNFGRGGLGGDPILAEGNDYSATNNANMRTFAEGGSPVMQMFIFPGPNPGRTSNLSSSIIIHELGHYISNRLIANSSGLTNKQGRAMGEGWGDIFSLIMTSKASNDFTNGVFGFAGWITHLIVPGYNDNYYFGIRRYPYSLDFTKSPITFRHISKNQPLPTGPPRNTAFIGPDNSQFHNAGQIWCAALWEVFANLITKHGHKNAEENMLRYLIGGLKLTPSRPTYTLARDAFISAVTTLNPDDLFEVWQGFARRGLGIGAISPHPSSVDLNGAVESFDIPAFPAEIRVFNGDSVSSPELEDGTYDSVDFGRINSGEKKKRPFLILNDGKGPLVIQSIQTPGQFYYEGPDFPLTIEPAKSLNFNIEFRPLTPGFPVGRVQIISNDQNENPFDFSIHGRSDHYAILPRVRIIDPDHTPAGNFGGSVAMSGNTLLVGAPGSWFQKPTFGRAGAAYFFKRDSKNWRFITKVFEPQSAEHERNDFGKSIALVGNLAVIGAPFYKPGRVYIYRRINGEWNLEQILTDKNAKERDAFGQSVSISENTILVGAPSSRGPGRVPSFFGVVFVYSKIGNKWKLTKKLSVPLDQGRRQIGTSVALSNDIAAIGAQFEKGGYLFSRNLGGANKWGKIKRFDLSLVENSATNGTTAIFGDNQSHKYGKFAGVVYLIQKYETGWELTGTIKGSDTSKYSRFGTSIAMDDERIVVGAPGKNQIYLFQKNGMEWNEIRKFDRTSGRLSYGASVAIDGSTIISGEHDTQQGAGFPPRFPGAVNIIDLNS